MFTVQECHCYFICSVINLPTCRAVEVLFSLWFLDRVADFLMRITHLEMQQGKLDEAEGHLKELKYVLDSPFSASQRTRNDFSLLLDHPEACTDPALHILHIRYSLTLSEYLARTSKVKESISALEVTDSLCENAEKQVTESLDALSKTLGLGDKSKKEVMLNPREDSVKCSTKTKGRSKVSKVKKSKNENNEVHVKNEAAAQALLSQFSASVYVMNADLLIQSGKLVKAQDLISGTLEVLEDTKKPCRTIQISLFPVLANLYYLSGLVNLLSAVDSCNDLESRWRSVNAQNLGDPCEANQSSEVELSGAEKPRKVIRRRTARSAKTVLVETEERSNQCKKERGPGRSRKAKKDVVVDSVEVTSKKKGTQKRSIKPTQKGESRLWNTHILIVQKGTKGKCPPCIVVINNAGFSIPNRNKPEYLPS